MEKRVLFLGWMCTFFVIISGTKDGRPSGLNLYEALSTDIKNELQDHISKIGTEFNENVVGKVAHQVYDFRVLILPSSHQCYYQEAENNTSITINYECVNSPSVTTNGKVSVEVILAGGEMSFVESNDAATSGDVVFEVKKKGTYAICFGNEDSGSVVIAQIQIDIWNHEEMFKFHREKRDDDDIVYQSNLRVFEVARSIALIRHAIKHTQSLLYYDYLTLRSNQSRVNNFSILSFILIASVCFIQLRVVKRMFGNQTSNV